MRDSRGEMTMTAEEMTLSKDPEIMGDVVYRFEFKINRGIQDTDIEISDVDVEELRNLTYAEDGSPVMMDEAKKQKFVQVAYNYFWKKLVHDAESKVTDRIELGPW